MPCSFLEFVLYSKCPRNVTYHLAREKKIEHLNTKLGTGYRVKVWGHIQGAIARKGLREETPLPLAVGQEEKSPKVGMSNCQNNNISQKCNKQVQVGL